MCACTRSFIPSTMSSQASKLAEDVSIGEVAASDIQLDRFTLHETRAGRLVLDLQCVKRLSGDFSMPFRF